MNKSLKEFWDYHQFQLPSYSGHKIENIKSYLLNYFHDKKRMIRLNVREEEIIGVISDINDDWVTLETFELICGRRTGCSVILEEQIEIFGEIQHGIFIMNG